ncbi:Transcription factor c2h2 [Neofusicoccum parvum]|uniref:Transcription factor c2h2 n=1 Tax=Neofusicoccum parvum TaxID=310453 RepID=A0ACB5S907_9PEZI|nr:Transcription factor c2h2 [Neofusicoccum parvum]
MHEQGEATQGTIDGSVTLPTLNVPVPEPEPDSPGGSLWLPSNTEIRPSPATRSPLRSLVSHASKAAAAQIGRVAAGLYELYGPEKPVPKDHVRVRWTCTCGRQLHDDFIERRRGAARELEAYLNRPRAHTAPSSPSHSANSSFSEPGQIFSSNPSLSASPATTWGSLGTAGDSSPASYSPNTLRSNNPFSVRVGTLPPPRWLLTCADEGQFTAKLSHVDVTETRVRSDKDLAMAVRGLYSHVNRRWWRLLRLRGLTSIDFVQFEVHRNRVVDIRKCPDMPPKQTGYDFEPHDLVPPVGAQYLMHLFAHPEDYDSEFITYARAPKKRNARLDVGVGWGINLVEGFLADRVWMLVMGFFVLGSTVFAVVWACKRGEDVQGAFGVASWMLTLAVLFVGWAQASLG